MNRGRLAVLLVEDSDDDAALVLRALTRAGWSLECVRCQDAAGLAAALTPEAFDLVISDYMLPGFGGIEALGMVRQRSPDLPFILVSGTIGEDAAVAAMRAGANDYLMKSALARLAPAVERELREAESRRRRRSAESALAASERLQRAVLAAITDAVITVDAEGVIVQANRAAGDLLGLSTTAMTGCPAAQVIRLLDPASHRPLHDPWVSGLAGPHSELSPPLLDGPAGRRVALRTAPLRDMDGAITGTVLAMRDVTVDLEREMDLRQAQRHAALGQLAAGVAHDFNNLLAAVMGHAGLLEADATINERARTRARTITDAADRGARIVARMASLGRRSNDEPVRLDLATEARAAIDLFAAACPCRLTITYAGPTGDLRTVGRSAELHSALINLLVNARDAMPGGGELRVECGEADLDATTAASALPPLVPGRWLRLAVVDHGVGMPPEVRTRVFEPFFTTKPPGQGTGLGLPSVLACAREHGGGVLVDSSPGAGTTVAMLLPPA